VTMLTKFDVKSLDKSIVHVEDDCFDIACVHKICR
jgi:hypothetical protein